MSQRLDLTGKRFGKLTAIQIDQNPENKRIKWFCICDCGNSTSVMSHQLVSGKTRSCGCKRYETKNQTHGLKQTRLYTIWCGMKKRCNNPSDHNYKKYGGRGIRVCEEWNNDFVAFNCWALLNGYEDNLTIDRINNDMDYSPNNCRWVTHTEQQRNKSNNVKILLDGETKTAAEWSEETGIPAKRIYQRYHRAVLSGSTITKDTILSDDLTKKKISQYTTNMDFVRNWDSAADAGKNGYSRSAITQCCRGQLKTHAGYVWKYAGE